MSRCARVEKMPKATKAKTAASSRAAPYKKESTSLFESRKRNHGIGNSIQPKRDLTHFVRWPKYVRLQRSRRILLQRLKVPPTLNQFRNSLDKSTCEFSDCGLCDFRR